VVCVLFLRRVLYLVCLCALLQGCSGGGFRESLLEQKTAPTENTGFNWKKKPTSSRTLLAGDSAQSGFEGFSQYGDDRFVNPAKKRATRGDDQADGEFTLNLVDVPIAQAAKSILGDAFGLSYTVDPRVAGNVTVQTPEAVSGSTLMEMFESTLRDNGAAVIRSGKGFRIVPLELASRNAEFQSENGGSDEAGVRKQIVPLRYVAAAEMRTVLEPMLPSGIIVSADNARNVLIIAGSPQEIASVRETVAVFDVDFMRGKSFALVPVKSSSAAAIANDLEQVFETKSGPLKGLVRIIPNPRLKSVLVISSRAKYVREATKWIKKLDVLSENNEESLHVYRVQNRNATDLAKVLASVLESDTGNSSQAEGRVAPKFETQTSENGTKTDAEGNITGGPETPDQGPDVIVQSFSQFEADPKPIPRKTRVVADDGNNSLLIFATAADFERIKNVLQEIDTVPNQVLLEAVIAEVTLDDDLKFGVRWFLGEQKQGATFSDAVSGAVSSVFPGFSYFLKSNDIAFTLNAISSVTNVRVLSAPSLVVLDNKSATLQVGDQVPIVTQSARGVIAGDAPIVSNVELKDTGVILKVTPRVNDSGLVTLDIEQEVSSVVKTTTSGIDSPTIRQRSMKTSVVVQDSEALALGGLIQEKENTGKSKVPVLGDIPILGTAFRNKSDAVSRTELIIFIRPRVIRDLNEARRVTEEFRAQLSVEAPRVRREDPLPGDELIRIFE
jgi:general secretion pathway protein D